MGITDEQSARLTTTSGSKHVTEMSDYNVGLYLEDGSVAAMGRTMPMPRKSMRLGILLTAHEADHANRVRVQKHRDVFGLIAITAQQGSPIAFKLIATQFVASCLAAIFFQTANMKSIDERNDIESDRE